MHSKFFDFNNESLKIVLYISNLFLTSNLSKIRSSSSSNVGQSSRQRCECWSTISLHWSHWVPHISIYMQSYTRDEPAIFYCKRLRGPQKLNRKLRELQFQHIWIVRLNPGSIDLHWHHNAISHIDCLEMIKRSPLKYYKVNA
jgi:hypothetical protein